jgi:protein-tyrosine phosphatase
MAEWLLRKLLEDRPIIEVQVRSAGFIALPGNTATHLAMVVAKEHGVGLERHQAQPLASSLIREADLILVMEPEHRRELLYHRPEAASKVFLLRHFAPSGGRDRAIADPYGRDLEAYRSCFQEIRECVEALYDWLSGVRCG